MVVIEIETTTNTASKKTPLTIYYNTDDNNMNSGVCFDERTPSELSAQVNPKYPANENKIQKYFIANLVFSR